MFSYHCLSGLARHRFLPTVMSLKYHLCHSSLALCSISQTEGPPIIGCPQMLFRTCSPSSIRVPLERTVAYLLKARTVEPEKQPLLANGSETTFISRQRLGKHVTAATDTHATIEVLLETVFYTHSVQRGYQEDNCGNRVSCARESVKKRDSWKWSRRSET
jgi:hypothetical protein